MASARNTAVGGEDRGTKISPGKVQLEPYPGPDALIHTAEQWRKSRDNRLAAAGLLHVAKGGAPPGIDKIQDYPLDAMPTPAPGSRDC